MWADAQRDGRPAEYRWRSLLNAARFGWRQLLECRAVTLPIYENARLGRKVNFAPCKISLGDKSPRKCIHTVAAKRQPNIVHRLAVIPAVTSSVIAAVTKPRRETHWNLLGCPKLVNPSKPLMGQSSQTAGDMWRNCCLTSFFRLSIHALVAKIQPDKLCDGAQAVNVWRFLRPVFQRVTCSTFQTCILNSR